MLILYPAAIHILQRAYVKLCYSDERLLSYGKHVPSGNKTEHSLAAVDTLWRCNRCHSPADSGGCTSARNAALVVAIHILQLLRRTLSSINACVYRLLLVALARKHACAVASKLHSLVVTTTTTTRHDLATPDSGELPPPRMKYLICDA